MSRQSKELEKMGNLRKQRKSLFGQNEGSLLNTRTAKLATREVEKFFPAPAGAPAGTFPKVIADTEDCPGRFDCLRVSPQLAVGRDFDQWQLW